MPSPLERGRYFGFSPRNLEASLRREREGLAHAARRPAGPPRYTERLIRKIIWDESKKMSFSSGLNLSNVNKAHLKLVGRTDIRQIVHEHGIAQVSLDLARATLQEKPTPCLAAGVGAITLVEVPQDGPNCYGINGELTWLRTRGDTEHGPRGAEYDPRDDIRRFLGLIGIENADEISEGLPVPEFRLGGIETSDPAFAIEQLQGAFRDAQLALNPAVVKK